MKRLITAGLLAGILITGTVSAARACTNHPHRPAGRVLLDHQGSGQWTSPRFQAPAEWRIAYAFDCANSFGQAGNFAVSVEGGSPGFSTAGVNELKLRGRGVTYVHDARGSVYLQVISECRWHIVAQR